MVGCSSGSGIVGLISLLLDLLDAKLVSQIERIIRALPPVEAEALPPSALPPNGRFTVEDAWQLQAHLERSRAHYALASLAIGSGRPELPRLEDERYAS